MGNFEKAFEAMDALHQKLKEIGAWVTPHISVADGFYAIEDQNGEVVLALSKFADGVILYRDRHNSGLCRNNIVETVKIIHNNINKDNLASMTINQRNQLNDWASYFEEVHNSDYSKFHQKLSQWTQKLGGEAPEQGVRLFRLKR